LNLPQLATGRVQRGGKHWSWANRYRAQSNL
jgi:hypothetical protein